MTGSAVSEAAKKQQWMKQKNKKTNDAVQEYQRQLLKTRKASYAEVAKKVYHMVMMIFERKQMQSYKTALALSTYWLAPLPGMRAKAGNQENISGYFALIKERIADPSVAQECVWSMDEMQANPDGSPTQQVVRESSLHQQHQQSLSNKQMITVIVTICADGTSISPTAVFKAKKVTTSWQKENVNKIAYVTNFMNGEG
ncbi:hypothetical protein BDM02DRAFT_3184566 [Thelephora ganbajun]|uniref:Uncharacterized protein n=1 Tax=Thelephora ganbajun TaxID=370292 RepID=A0ACB6ZNR4_THEGA|nr:hypothetical protein BDM02DRAFT_3184566 [Thelephora ganbajun]